MGRFFGKTRWWAVLVTLGVCWWLVLVVTPAQAGEEAPQDVAVDPRELLEENLTQQMDSLDFSQVEAFLEGVDTELGEYLPDLDLRRVAGELARGELSIGFKDLLQGLFRYLFAELSTNWNLLARLLALAVLCVLLQYLQGSFEGSTVSRLAYSISYLALMVMVLSSFTMAVDIARNSVEQMVSFLQALLPLMLTLLTAVGGLTSAAVMHPVILGAVSVLSTLIKSVVLPLIYLIVVLNLVSRLAENFQVSRLAGFLNQVTMAILGVSMTVFIGLLGIQGVAGAVRDGVTLRTAKFLSGAFIPVVGKALGDALESVIGTSLLLKNALGLVGAVVILALAAFPAVKVLALMVIYKLGAALIQPMGDGELAASLDTMGNALALVFAALAVTGLMFFLTLVIIVGLGNLTVMLR